MALWCQAESSLTVWVSVGQLNGHQTLSQGQLALLASAGVTQADYPNILARDPLANSSYIDPNKFIPLQPVQYFSYTPPTMKGGPTISTTASISTSTIQTRSSSITDTYGVTLNMSVSGDFFSLAQATFRDTNSWSWSNVSTNSATTGSTEVASVKINGPSYGWPGPVIVEVLYGTIFHTFAFTFVNASNENVVKGLFCDEKGKPVRNSSVLMVGAGATARAYTDGLGQFLFPKAYADGLGRFLFPKAYAENSVSFIPESRSKRPLLKKKVSVTSADLFGDATVKIGSCK